MSHYNGAAIIGMKGANCIGLVADRRLGRQMETVDSNFQKVFKMQDNILLGISGLATDIQTFHAKMEYKLNMFRLRENREMTAKSFAHLVSNTLYEHRFGPFMVQPVVAGLDDGEPVLAGYDQIGCMTEEPFICAGSGDKALLGTGENYYREAMNAQEIEDA